MMDRIEQRSSAGSFRPCRGRCRRGQPGPGSRLAPGGSPGRHSAVFRVPAPADPRRRVRHGRLLPAVPLVALLAWLPALPASGQPAEAPVGAHVVVLHIDREGTRVGETAGVAVGDQGGVVTSATAIAAGTDISVVLAGEARPAEILLADPETGLGIVRVSDFPIAGLPLSIGRTQPGDWVVSALPATESGPALASGAVLGFHTLDGGTDGTTFLRHSAIIPGQWFGAPLINSCGVMVGVNLPLPAGAGPEPDTPGAEEQAFALESRELVARLREFRIDPRVITEPCTAANSVLEEEAQEAARARDALDEAERRAEELEERAQQAEADAAASAEERQSARAEAEQAGQDAAAARSALGEAEAALAAAAAAARAAEQQAEEERLRSAALIRLAMWGGAGGAVLLLLVALFWARSSRRRSRDVEAERQRAEVAEAEAVQAQLDVAAARAPAPFDCFLVGTDSQGAACAISLHRDAWPTEGGVIVGRDPSACNLVIADASVSRSHARLRYRGDGLIVEDLDSTNGTFVNGRPLTAGVDAGVASGDRLRIGSVELRVDLRA